MIRFQVCSNIFFKGQQILLPRWSKHVRSYHVHQKQKVWKVAQIPSFLPTISHLNYIYPTYLEVPLWQGEISSLLSFLSCREKFSSQPSILRLRHPWQISFSKICHLPGPQTWMKLQAKSALKHRINMLDLKLQRSSFPTRRDYSTTLRSLLLFFNFNRKSFLQGAVTETGNSRGFPGRRQLITVGEVLKANAKHQVFTTKKNHLSTFTELLKYLEAFIFQKKKKSYS